MSLADKEKSTTQQVPRVLSQYLRLERGRSLDQRRDDQYGGRME